jgi:hypothetical protein
MGERARAWLLLGALGALTAVAGCAADQGKLREADLAELLGWLPGSYDTSAQADQDARTGARPAHERIAMVIVRVYAPRLGHHVQYVQEMAPDDPNRVMSQRLFSFKVDDKRGIIQSVYTFVEPLRWRDGQKDIVLFTGIDKDDVQTLSGCELTWTKVGGPPAGKKPAKDAIIAPVSFSGTVDAARCHPRGVFPGSIKLTDSSLTIGDYEYLKSRN